MTKRRKKAKSKSRVPRTAAIETPARRRRVSGKRSTRGARNDGWQVKIVARVPTKGVRDRLAEILLRMLRTPIAPASK